jgi:nucleoid-associated protein YgaU
MFLGGGVLVLAVAGGAWALFGRDDRQPSTSAIGPKVPTSAPGNPVLGPAVPGVTKKPTTSPTNLGPVAPTQSVATTNPKPAPTKGLVATPPTVTPPTVAKPPVAAPQREGTVAKRDYTFKVARGDTLWDLTERVLGATGRSTSNASVAAFVPKLFASNAQVLGSDPNLILVGQTVVWPSGL